jgi:hypothetical protein
MRLRYVEALVCDLAGGSNGLRLIADDVSKSGVSAGTPQAVSEPSVHCVFRPRTQDQAGLQGTVPTIYFTE